MDQRDIVWVGMLPKDGIFRELKSHSWWSMSE